MPRSATFADYYTHLATGVGGDGNVKGFNKAMDLELNLWDVTRAFNNPVGIILAAGPNKKVKIIHGLIDFGNNISHPASKVCGHIGMGDTAFGGHLDYIKALLNIQYDTPTENEFTAATTKEALRELQQTGATSMGDTYTFDGSRVFFLIPTAQQAIMKCQSTCPLDIMLVAWEAITELINSLGLGDSNLIDELEIHLTNLVFFCWEVYNELIPTDSLFESDADDIELNEFSQVYHNRRITSHHTRLTASAPMPPQVDNVCDENLTLLTATLTRVVGD